MVAVSDLRIRLLDRDDVLPESRSASNSKVYKMKWYMISLVVVALAGMGAVIFNNTDIRAKFTKCEESVLGPEASSGRCVYPSRVMRVRGVWICSCRTEAETKKGIE